MKAIFQNQSFRVQGQSNSATQELNLTVIQSTCLSNEICNSNNAIEGSNLIFVSGAYLVMQNIFQNLKTFVHRINQTPAIGIAIHQSTDSYIVVATNKIINEQDQAALMTKQKSTSAQLCLQLYSYLARQAVSIKLEGIDSLIDLQFLDRKRLLILATKDQANYICILNFADKQQKLWNARIMAKPSRILLSERKTYILTNRGILQFDQYCDENIDNWLFYNNLAEKIIDFKTADNELDILLLPKKISIYLERELLQSLQFDQIFKNEQKQQSQKSKNQQQIPSCFVQIGRNLLVGYKTSICISQFIVEDRKIRFVNNFWYKNKTKGGILNIQQSFDEMHLAMTVLVGSNRQKKRIQNFMFNLSILSTDKKFINPFMRMCPMGLQNGQITSFQNTISSDTYFLSGQYIVNYNYLQAIEKKGKYPIHQSPKYLAVHPLGYQFLCVFENTIKFYTKVEQDFIQIWTEQMVCTCARYSTNGMLALAYCQDSFYQVQIYDPYVFSKIKEISQIYWKTPILRIQWCHFATCIAVYAYNEFALYKTNGEKLLQYKQNMMGNSPPANHNIPIISNLQTLNLNKLINNASLGNTHLGAILATSNSTSTQNNGTNMPLSVISINSISAMEYDQQKQALLFTTLNKQFYYCRKEEEPTGDDLLWQMQNIKYCHIQEVITCIKISSNLKTIFFGTINGNLLWTQYPFQSLIEPGTTLPLQKLQFHCDPITNISLSNNYKFILISIGEGIFITKVKKLSKYQNVYVMFQDLEVSNLNFLEMSSVQFLYQGRQKLKTLLQKRKTSFNELQQIKKQWDAKRQTVIRTLEVNCQKQQLEEIDQTLLKLNKFRKQKKELHQQIEKIEQQKKTWFNQDQRKLQRQLLQIYNQNDNLKRQRREIKQRCQKQYQEIREKCCKNIKQIQVELDSKFENFIANFQKMKSNIINHQMRLDLQRQQQKQEQRLLVEKKFQDLKEKDRSLQQELNDLRAKTARSKKEMDRFLQRRYFLQVKKRFFDEELSYCHQEKQQLEHIKEKLESELDETEVQTNKKQRRLKKYYKQTSMLSKFRTIHQYVKQTTNRQVQFFEEQSKKIFSNIISIQNQLSQAVQLNQNSEKKINSLSQQIAILKQAKKTRQSRFRYINLLHNEIILALEKLESDKKQVTNQEKVREMNGIYTQFYVNKKLQSLINLCSQKQQESQDAKNFMDSYEKRNNRKIHENLIGHKKYLEENLHLFDKNCIKNKEQTKLRYLKYQAQNYNLIAECNVRKQQTSKKKRILHELMDSVKQTQVYLNQLNKNAQQDHLITKVNKNFSVKKDNSAPLIAYVKNKKPQNSLSRKNLTIFKERQGFSQYSTSAKPESVHFIKRMLDIHKVSQKENCEPKSQAIRRIKTAMTKKKTLANQKINIDDENGFIRRIQADFQNKPKTAQSKKRVKISGARDSQNTKTNQSNWQLNSNANGKDKSLSKPTTCTFSSSKIKYSMAM